MKKSCYAYLITNEIVHKIPLPTLHTLPQWHFQSVEGCITHSNSRSEKRFHLCSGCLRKSFGGEEARGSLPVAALLLMCSFAATRTGRLEKAIVESLVTSGSTVMILPVSAESKLCIRQSDTSRWTCGMTPHSGWALAGRGQKLWHKEKPVLQHRWQLRTPHLELDLIILGTSDLHPSQLIGSLHKRVFEEAGSGARVHGWVHYGDINIIHVWHDKNFL